MQRLWLAALHLLLAVLEVAAEIDRTFVPRIYAKYVSTDYLRHDTSVIKACGHKAEKSTLPPVVSARMSLRGMLNVIHVLILEWWTHAQHN
jgi:hypothetical protein